MNIFHANELHFVISMEIIFWMAMLRTEVQKLRTLTKKLGRLFALFLIKMQNCQIWRFGHIWDRNSGNPVSKITMEELNSAPIRPVSDSFQEYEIPNRLIN